VYFVNKLQKKPKMRKILAIASMLSLLAFTAYHQQIASNQIKGVVQFHDCPKTIKKGTGYNKDGTEVMHADDPMATTRQNVILSLHPLSFTPTLTPTADAYITQKEQTFLPHVLPITVGSKVHFLNEDEFFHNVQSFTSKARFSIGRRAPGIAYSQKIKKTGAISLMCDIHSHMNAVILSLDTPYFTRVAPDGSYRIDNLPDGDYRLEIFHPNCSKITDKVSLKDGQLTTLDYDFLVKP